MKKLLQKTTAVLVSAALAVTCALPAFAEQPTEGVTKDENVFLILNPDGSVSEQIVSDWLHSDTGFDAAADRSTLSGITNLKSDVLPAQDGENLTWTTEDNDIYYQGTTTQTPPVTVDITYTLDGRSITADALAGKSGHLVMRLALTNNEGQEMEIAGSRRKVYTPFFTVAAATLPTGSYTNIAAQHGTVQTDAKTQLVCFLAMPGMAETFGGLLPEALSGLEDYMLDELVIEADVKDCTPPAFMLAAATSMDQLTSELDIPDLSGQMSQLEDATAQLQSGAATLHEATGTLQSKMDEFAASYATFDTGLDNALSGAQQVQSGAQNLLDGAKSLDNGTQQLADGTQQLNSGAQQVADGVLASANKTLKEGGLIDTDMTWDNYAAVIDNILTINDKTLAAGRRKMVRTIWEQAPSFKDSQLDLALYLSATKTNHDLEAALHLMQNYDPSMLCGLVQLLTSQEAKDTAKAELKYQVENSQDIADVRALKDSLSKIQYFVSSVGQYTAGVQTAADGAHSAKDGSAQLAAGTKTLYDGVNTLNEGASQLNDGTHQLNDGLNQFNEEGISKLTGALDQDQLHGLKTVLDEMSDRLESYTSFAGAPEDAESSVKFVYKTAETVAAADNVVAETETVKEGNIFTRLWQRIVNLFKF